MYLTLYYHPSMKEARYDGSCALLRGVSVTVSEVFDSTLRLSLGVRGGLLIRQAHHRAAPVFLAALFVHMMRVLFAGAFRKPRELTWTIGVLCPTASCPEPDSRS